MEILSLSQIQDRYYQVQARIADAAERTGRDSKEIRLMVVTKGHALETVRAVVDAGAQVLGENYVEEAIEKITTLDISKTHWHMIGHVQSRKARLVCQYFSCMHSLDRLKIARRLDAGMAEMGGILPVLIECNLSGEETKFGYPLWAENRWPEFLSEIRPLLEFQNLEIQGLMTMPPYHPDPENSRPYFQKLAKLRDFLADFFPHLSWRELSMGMSNDFEVAIEEGATIVRVGTAIVGPRI